MAENRNVVSSGTPRRVGYPCHPPPAYPGHCWDYNRPEHYAGDERCYVQSIRNLYEEVLTRLRSGGFTQIINIESDANATITYDGSVFVGSALVTPPRRRNVLTLPAPSAGSLCCQSCSFCYLLGR